jgi:UDP-glucose 4-epimerase
MHIADCLDAMAHVVERATDPYNVYNLGTETTTSVTAIADIVADVMDVEPTYEFTGGDRGWTGDVPKMRLDIEKLADLDWTPAIESDEAIRRAAEALVDEV